MPASDTHPDYAPRVWEKVRDCVKGAIAIKKRAGGSGNGAMFSLPGTRYLPAPSPEDEDDDNKMRYASYRERANFVNFTGATLEGMIGMVFREDMVVELPESISYLEDSADGGELSLDQLSKSLTSNLLQAGRHGLLVDYPKAEVGLTQAEVAAKGLQASILSYDSENIKNWRTEVINGKKMLVMVVLAEPTKKYTEDGFSYKELMYHRVLRLVEGKYIQELYDENDVMIVAEDGTTQAEVRKADGSAWDMIPFVFVGAVNNDESVDKAPLLDIAEVNIAHYHNSADYEESCFIVGQPTPVFSGLTQTWVDKVMKNGVKLGSRKGVLLPVGGSGDLLQANENQMPMKGMEHKEAQMVNLGARIIQDSVGTETAEAAKIRFAGQNSKLSNIVGNVEDALMNCFDWISEFMGAKGQESLIELNRKFYDATMDPQLVIAQIQLMDRQVIAKTDLRRNLRNANMIDSDRSDEDIDGDVEEIDPLAGNEEIV